MDSINDLQTQIENVKNNPTSMLRIMLEQLESFADNQSNSSAIGLRELADPSSPFMFLMECTNVNSSVAMGESAALTRKQYPSMALTEDELYLHMSDKDFVDRFSSPSRTTFYVMLGKEEIYQRAVKIPNTDIRKITIPRHSEFSVSGVKFTMQYPIDVRILSHGGLQVVYDNTQTSPLQTLETNLVNWQVVNIEGVDWVAIEVPVNQFKITTQYAQLTPSTGFKEAYSIDDSFCYCRAFMANSDGNGWTEIKTTHTDQVFDPMDPTVVVTVYEKAVMITIPHVYMTTDIINRELRFDIYTTKGPLDMVLSNYTVDAFSANWVDLEQDDAGVYQAPLSAFSNIAVMSSETVTGGKDRLSFETLRSRVIENAVGTPNLPITDAQLTADLSNLGYTVLKDVDNVTNRIYLASRSLPAPSDGSLQTGANGRVFTLQTTMDALPKYDSVENNGERMTLLPSTLYRNEGGLIKIVDSTELDQLEAYEADIRVNRINDNDYLYSPFYYVLDTTESVFDVRPYHLGSPAVKTRQFIEENSTLGYSIGTSAIKVSKTDTGYRVQLLTRSGDNFKALDDDRIYVQLGFRPVLEDLDVHMNGTLVSTNDEGERIYQWDITTNHDIDSSHNLDLTSFRMYNSEQENFFTPLSTTFDIYYLIDGITNGSAEDSEIDYLYGRDLVPDGVRGVTHEQATIELGVSLDNLWAQNRTVIDSVVYETYPEDVISTYEENVYEKDANGNKKLYNEDGKLGFKILHRKGDAILDSDGNEVIRYFQGEPILDSDGNPIPKDQRNLLRQMDLYLIDGRHYFVTETQAVGYRDELTSQIVSWLTDDIASISEDLLEQTRLYLYPQSTLGDIKVMVQEGRQVTIPSTQSLKVTYYLTKNGYRDSDLRTALTDSTVEVIANVFSKAVVSNNDIVTQLSAIAGGEVKGIDVEGLGGEEEYGAITMLDESMRLSIAKKLVSLADGRFSVEDDVRIDFLQHEILS